MNKEEIKFLSVKEFADATGRFPNQIYDFINKGNKFRKLIHVKVDNKIKIPESEINNYPFNATIKSQIDFRDQLEDLDCRVSYLEDLVLP